MPITLLNQTMEVCTFTRKTLMKECYTQYISFTEQKVTTVLVWYSLVLNILKLSLRISSETDYHKNWVELLKYMIVNTTSYTIERNNKRKKHNRHINTYITESIKICWLFLNSRNIREEVI